MKLLRPLIILIGLLGLWQAVVMITGAPPYILPQPYDIPPAAIS
jgi:putative hydroxymethylpyrimidine transport system permease protein